MKTRQGIRWCLGWLSIPMVLLVGCQTVTPATGTPPPTAEAPPPALESAVPSPTPAPTDYAPTSPTPAPSVSGQPEPAQPASPAGQPPVPPAEAEHLVAAAQADLAQRLGISAQTITVQSIEAVEWPDTSLGCPQPGMMYAQVITPGFRIVLETEGEAHEVHTTSRGAMVWCTRLPPSGTPSKGIDTTVDDGWPSQPLGDDVIILPPAEQK